MEGLCKMTPECETEEVRLLLLISFSFLKLGGLLHRQDFARYSRVEQLVRTVTSAMTLEWLPWRYDKPPSMYNNLAGLALQQQAGAGES